ncbi:unnamed protein product, partial [Prorocentrum cordatum]
RPTAATTVGWGGHGSGAGAGEPRGAGGVLQQLLQQDIHGGDDRIPAGRHHEGLRFLREGELEARGVQPHDLEPLRRVPLLPEVSPAGADHHWRALRQSHQVRPGADLVPGPGPALRGGGAAPTAAHEDVQVRDPGAGAVPGEAPGLAAPVPAPGRHRAPEGGLPRLRGVRVRHPRGPPAGAAHLDPRDAARPAEAGRAQELQHAGPASKAVGPVCGCARAAGQPASG